LMINTDQHHAVDLCAVIVRTASKFSLRIWLDKQTVLDHRNSVKLQTLSFSHGKPHPTAMRPWRRVEPT